MGTSSSSFLGRRIDPGAAPLAVGDVVAIAAIVAIGVVTHTSVDYLLANLGAWIAALLPFLVAWVVVAPLVGAYSPGAAESSKAAVPLAVRSWIGADVLAVVIRGLTQVSTLVSLAIFFVVMLFVGAVALGLWRYLYFRLR